jgi:hypothetical protein
MHRPNAPTPGSTTPDAPAASSAWVTSTASAPAFSNAFWAERRFPIP